MRPNALAVLLAVVLLGVALAFAGSPREERWRALGVPELRVEFRPSGRGARRLGARTEGRAGVLRRAVRGRRFRFHHVLRGRRGCVERRSILFDCGGMAPRRRSSVDRQRGSAIASRVLHALRRRRLAPSAVHAQRLLARLLESAAEWSAVGQPLRARQRRRGGRPRAPTMASGRCRGRSWTTSGVRRGRVRDAVGRQPRSRNTAPRSRRRTNGRSLARFIVPEVSARPGAGRAAAPRRGSPASQRAHR